MISFGVVIDDIASISIHHLFYQYDSLWISATIRKTIMIRYGVDIDDDVSISNRHLFSQYDFSDYKKTIMIRYRQHVMVVGGLHLESFFLLSISMMLCQHRIIIVFLKTVRELKQRYQFDIEFISRIHLGYAW
jgi:hypothetical protein